MLEGAAESATRQHVLHAVGCLRLAEAASKSSSAHTMAGRPSIVDGSDAHAQDKLRSSRSNCREGLGCDNCIVMGSGTPPMLQAAENVTMQGALKALVFDEIKCRCLDADGGASWMPRYRLQPSFGPQHRHDARVPNPRMGKRPDGDVDKSDVITFALFMECADHIVKPWCGDGTTILACHGMITDGANFLSFRAFSAVWQMTTVLRYLANEACEQSHTPQISRYLATRVHGIARCG